MGGINRGNPEIRHHGQIAVGISDPVTVRLYREPSGRNHDANSVGIRLHAGEQKSHF